MLVNNKEIISLDQVKIAVRDFEAETVRINFNTVVTLDFLTFADFEAFTKKLYASYKKLKYVFEKKGK